MANFIDRQNDRRRNETNMLFFEFKRVANGICTRAQSSTGSGANYYTMTTISAHSESSYAKGFGGQDKV